MAEYNRQSIDCQVKKKVWTIVNRMKGKESEIKKEKEKKEWKKSDKISLTTATY